MDELGTLLVRPPRLNYRMSELGPQVFVNYYHLSPFVLSFCVVFFIFCHFFLILCLLVVPFLLFFLVLLLFFFTFFSSSPSFFLFFFFFPLSSSCCSSSLRPLSSFPLFPSSSLFVLSFPFEFSLYIWESRTIPASVCPTHSLLLFRFLLLSLSFTNP